MTLGYTLDPSVQVGEGESMRQREYYVFTVSKGSIEHTKYTFRSAAAAAQAVVHSLHSCDKVAFGSNGQGDEWLKMADELHVAITRLSATPHPSRGQFEEPRPHKVMTGIL